MAVQGQGIGVINFEVYRSGTNRLMGLASVELPTIEYETVDAKGNGLAGTRAFPIRANTGSMELKLTWRTTTEEAATLIRHETIDLSLYGAISSYDAATGAIETIQHRIETRVIPKTVNLGKFEPSATADNENTFEIMTLNYYIKGVEWIAIDWANYVFRVNGRDYGQPVRTATGLR